jgi:hypothetical protein
MKKILLPYPCKVVGIILLCSGVALAIMYLWFNFRFMMPVFAVYSSFIETKTLATFRTNFADELTLLLLITGLAMIVLSKEKNETVDLDMLRLKAMAKALITNTIFILLSIFLVYGSGFIAVLVCNLIFFPIMYLIFFYLTGRKIRSNKY